MAEFDYAAFLDGVGIEKGDILDVASDMLSITQYCRKNKLKFDSKKLIDALKNLVGNKGTLMIRTFTWDFNKGKGFDIRKSPSCVGALGNVAMKLNDFKRTKHPMYSWMVWGKYTNELCALENLAAFGDGTPFDFLVRKDAKFLTLGNLSGHSMTLLHHMECVCNVPYRCEKVFEGEYTDSEGRKSIRRYTMYVQPLNYKVEDIHDDNSDKFWKSMELRNKVYDNELSVKSFSCLLISEVWKKELLCNEGATVFTFDGIPGYKACGIDWYTARYYYKEDRR